MLPRFFARSVISCRAPPGLSHLGRNFHDGSVRIEAYCANDSGCWGGLSVTYTISTMKLNSTLFLATLLILSSTTVNSRNIFRNDLARHDGNIHKTVDANIIVEGPKFSQLEKRRGGGGGRGGGSSGGGGGGRSGGGGSGGSRGSPGSRPNRYVNVSYFPIFRLRFFQIPSPLHRDLHLQAILPEIPPVVTRRLVRRLL